MREGAPARFNKIVIIFPIDNTPIICYNNSERKGRNHEETEESQNLCGNLSGRTQDLGQRKPRHSCDSRQAVQETEAQRKGVGLMDCPLCGGELEMYEHYDYWDGSELTQEQHFECSNCHDYTTSCTVHYVMKDYEWSN